MALVVTLTVQIW